MSAWIPSVAHIDLLVTHMVGPGSLSDRVSVSPHTSCAGRPGIGWELVSDSDLDTYGGLTVNQSTADTAGRVLLAGVVASVAFRYPRGSITELPGVTAELPLLPDLIAGGYRWRPTGRDMSPVAVIKQAHCYQYQACERPDWPTSLAHMLTEALIGRMIQRAPGYANAPWGYDRPESEPVSIMDMIGGAR